VERGLLVANLLPLLVGALAVALTGEEGFARVLPRALASLATLLAAAGVVHLLLCAIRFQGDQVIVPVLCLLSMVGGVYHLGLLRPGGRDLTIESYVTDSLVAWAVTGGVIAGAPWLRRLGMLFEEQVWWRVARDRPYYRSVPFHLGLLVLMLLLVVWLVLGGRDERGALVRAPLPGGRSFTPSEFIRLAVAFFLADYLAVNSRVLRNLRQPLGRVFPLNRIVVEHRPELLALLTTVLLYCIFFYGFRDFGPAAVIFLLTLLCLYAATGRLPTPLGLAALAVLVVALPTYYGWGMHTFANRLEMWWDPWDTHFVGGDHLARVLWGVASGGWFGVGVGTVNLRAFLPEAAKDTAFAGLAATMGLWSALAVLALFGALFWRGYAIARTAADDHGRLLAFSLTTLLALETVWICAAGVRVLPLSGINLPFISTGMSSMIASAIAVASLLLVSHTAETRVPEASDLGARGLERAGKGVLALLALPVAGLLAYGVPFFLGDRTLVRTARAIGGAGTVEVFSNPYLEQYRQRFGRGSIMTADGKLLAETRPVGGPAPAPRGLFGRFTSDDWRRPRERRYPLGPAAAQLVGWTTQGKFTPGRGSVETLYDDQLRGYREQDLPRLFRTRHNPVGPKPHPRNVQLTIRSDLQQFAAQKLRETVRSVKGAGGAVVIFDAAVGEVLAAATYPTFDPNGLTLERMRKYVQAHADTAVLTNKALAPEAIYFPGSTFKLITAAAALEDPVEGAAYCRASNARELTWSANGHRFKRKPGKIRDYGTGSHGRLSLSEDMEKALAVSCNVYFATLATKLGPARMDHAIRQAGLSHPPKAADLASYLPETGFGQVTTKAAPIELATLAAGAGMAGSAGDVVGAARPVWVKKVTDDRGRDVRLMDLPGMASTGEYRPFMPATMRTLHTMMLAVANSPGGTAYRAFHTDAGEPRLTGIEVGGKTGTAEYDKEVREPKGRSLTRHKHVWFVGFARRPDRIPPPTLAFAVLVEDAQGRVTGGSVCAPLARELIREILHPEPLAPAAAAPSGPKGVLDDAVQRARDALQQFGRNTTDRALDRVRGAIEEQFGGHKEQGKR
jgi:cell division protein FtsI/penicillin-binding protein 2/cell division protein FtsW (lipid II flippase)